MKVSIAFLKGKGKMIKDGKKQEKNENWRNKLASKI